jgi:hypothetical protein
LAPCSSSCRNSRTSCTPPGRCRARRAEQQIPKAFDASANPLQKARESGRSATVDVVELFSVGEGLISEIRVFQQDTHLLLATLEPH